MKSREPKKTKSKLGEVKVSNCGSRAVVTITPRASGAVSASLPMCFDDDEQEWFPCGKITGS